MMTTQTVRRALEGLDPEMKACLRPAKARFIEPMRATLTHEPFSHSDWIYERKFDGVRIVAVRRDGVVTLFTRNQKVTDAPYPEVKEALEALGDPTVDFVVDGEVVALDDDDQTSFSLLQRRMQKRDPRAARATGVPIHLYLFDLLNLDGHDTVAMPLVARKALLRRTFSFVDPLRYTEDRPEHGERYHEEACALGWEGLIAKQRDATYVSRRSAAWQKLKCSASQEFVIAGFTDPQGSRQGFGALLVGYHDGGGRLRYAGKVGTGFTDRQLRDLHRALRGIEVEASPFFDEPRERGAHWVSPALICEVEFGEWTVDGRLRHPRFKGLRSDKAPHEVTRER